MDPSGRVFEYQHTGRYFGMIAEDLKDLGAEELDELGAKITKKVYRGVFFQCDLVTLYRICYRSRFFSRITAPVLTFDCHSDRYLYSTARSIDWSRFLSPDRTFAVFSTVQDSRINHSHYAALKLKDAVADWFMDNQGIRPSVETINPDLWIGLRIFRNRAYIRLDVSGGPMHRRGYRQASVEAPMQETLAAAIVQMSGWNGETGLHDPFCGSGTLLTEALMKYCRIPSGYLMRKFGFQNLPEFDEEEWKTVRHREDSLIKELPEGLISGSDISGKAIDAASTNCHQLPFGERIQLRACSFEEIDDLSNQTIITNPPYGLRLMKGGNVDDLVRRFGDFLKQRCTGSKAWIYFGKRKLIKSVGLKTTAKIPLRNGKLDGRLALYEIY